MKKIGLYIHIPFCVRKCNYCDFLSFSADDETKKKYTDSLIREIGAYADALKEYSIATIYIGGGTPSVLDIRDTERIVRAAADSYNADFSGKEFEFTMEVNPGTVTAEKLSAYRDMGINRLSMGVQSASDTELAMLGRIHTFYDAECAMDSARKAGFDNISLDLISALPGQTIEQYMYSVNKILDLEPEHISSYSLIIEEGTEFYEKYGPDGPLKGMLPDETTERRMYYMTRDRLEERGYYRYEISNYAKPGYESRHNSSYWEGTEYLGLGLGASSLMGNTRYRNTADMAVYLDNPVTRETDEILDKKARMTEYMILGLRKTKGISISGFRERFDADMYEIFGKEIKRSLSEGLLAVRGDMLHLTDRGLDVCNYVFERFI